MQETIRKILEVAVHTPSGENAQPWRFVVKDNRVSVFNIPERDQSLYNFNQLGSYVAHGALIENIIIAATAHGYSADPHVFPDKKKQDLVAIIDLQKTNIAVDPLHIYIEKRCTNRKPYKKNMPLSAEQVNELVSAQEAVMGGKVIFIQEKEKIKVLAWAGSMNERVMFDNQFLHNFFFTHITWTKEEDEKNKIGFYIKTLEMPAPAQVAMRLFRYWSIMRVLNKLGVAKAIAQTNAGVYASSSAIGAVIIPKNDLSQFVAAGRIMQRAWLTATKLGLSIQPLTGVLFFTLGINAGKKDKFLSHHLEIIGNAHAEICRAFEIKDKEEVAMMFRIGYDGEPSARSSKLPPDVVFEDKSSHPHLHPLPEGEEKSSLPFKGRGWVEIMDRNSAIEEIIGDLNSLLSDNPVSNEYAVRENIAFFKAMRSGLTYTSWLLFRANRIDPAELLELTDFPLPEWIREMHLQLIEIERRRFPGLIRPLVDGIVEFIHQRNPRIVVNFGCGGMEAERQVIDRLKEAGYPNRLIFIGVDKSPIVKEIARANLKGLEDVLDIYEVEELRQEFLISRLAANTSRHAVVLCKNDIFEMDRLFNERAFDLIFHSMFRHHLPNAQKTSLDRIASSLAKAVMEYDNYRSWGHLIPPSIAIWKRPPLLNGAVFSRLKAPTRSELQGRKEGRKEGSASASLRFFNMNMIGTYLLKHNFGH